MFQVYLYITEKKIAGVLVTETLNQGYRMMNNKCCSETPPRCLWSQSYLDPGFLSSLKIATRLLDAIRYYLKASILIVQFSLIYYDFVSRRSDFIYEIIITIEEVAFSVATENGLSFAQRFEICSKRLDVNVYIM